MSEDAKTATATFKINHRALEAILGEDALIELEKGAAERLAEEIARKIKSRSTEFDSIDPAKLAKTVADKAYLDVQNRWNHYTLGESAKRSVDQKIQEELAKLNIDQLVEREIARRTESLKSEIDRYIKASADREFERMQPRIAALARSAFVEVLREVRAESGS